MNNKKARLDKNICKNNVQMYTHIENDIDNAFNVTQLKK